MSVRINGKSLLEHATFWNNKSDEECIQLASNEFGVDTERASLNMLERDFCTDFNNELIKSLLKK